MSAGGIVAGILAWILLALLTLALFQGAHLTDEDQTQEGTHTHQEDR